MLTSEGLTVLPFRGGHCTPTMGHAGDPLLWAMTLRPKELGHFAAWMELKPEAADGSLSMHERVKTMRCSGESAAGGLGWQ
jgi:hypothetical protein